MKLGRTLLAQLRSTRTALGWTVALSVIGAGVSLAQASRLSQIIADVFLRGATLATTWNSLLIILALMSARAVFAWGSEISAVQMAARLKQHLRARVLTHLFNLGPTYARGERTGELTHVVSEGIEALDAYLSQYLPQLALAALVPLLILAFVFPLDWLSALVLLVTGPLIPLFMILIGQAADALTRQQYRELGTLSAYFLDVLQGLATLKIFGRSQEHIALLTRVGERYRNVTLRVLRVAFLSAFALEMIATLGTAIVAVQVGVRLLYGQLQFEQAFFVLLVAPDFYLPLRLLGTRFHAGMTGIAAAERLFQILDTPATPVARFKSGKLTRQLAPRITFHNVAFTYPASRTALDDVSFTIEPGQRIALVGATGAGKTTIAHLLLRFIAPTRGQILCDGVPLATTPHGQIAWVPQSPYLFNTSLAENICLARPHAPLAEIVRAAQLAHADEFIRALPQGYATRIGERGARLSGGQAQRIALARAFFADAPLLILDEATAQLDAENANALEDTVERLLENRTGRTTLVITHRLATARRADHIMVLDAGRVIERGTHAELMQARGAYYRLATAWQTEPGQSPVDESASAANPPPRAISAEQMTLDADTPRAQSAPAILARLVTFVAPFKWRIALAILLGSATIASSIGLLATSAYLIASAALHPSIADLAIPIVGVRFFGIARGGMRYLERLVSHDVNLRVLAYLRVWFYATLEPGAPAQLLTRRSGDLVARIIGDVETLQNFFVRILAPPFVALVIALGVTIYLAAFSIPLALGVLGLMFCVGVILPVAIQPVSRAANRRLVELRAALNAHVVDSLQGMADLIAFDQAEAANTHAQDLSRELIRAQTRLARLAAAQSALSNWLAQLAVWYGLYVAIPLVAAAQLDGILLPMLTLTVQASFEGALALPLAFQYLESNVSAARRLFEIADVPQPGFQFNHAPRLAPQSQQNLALCMHDVSFRYAPNEPRVLAHANFDMPFGATIAITGASGAGKSTLVNLLVRFWDFEDGTIFVNGHDLRDLSPDAARQFFSVVTQPVHLFNGTIRDNLLLARPKATDAELVHAAEVAQVHSFIAALPQGYATRVGEQGLQLSGGERQRLAIARALLRDAPILVLDEATAQLDALTERAVLHAIRETGRTTLVITHRAQALADCWDHMLVLQNGRLENFPSAPVSSFTTRATPRPLASHSAAD